MNLSLGKKVVQVLADASPTKTVSVKAGDRMIELSGEALVALLELADQRGTSLGTVLAEAIAVQKAIADERAKVPRSFSSETVKLPEN